MGTIDTLSPEILLPNELWNTSRESFTKTGVVYGIKFVDALLLDLTIFQASRFDVPPFHKSSKQMSTKLTTTKPETNTVHITSIV